MSSIYKRKKSKRYQWSAYYKGKKLRKSTGMTQKHLARKIQDEWDLQLKLGILSFLGGRYSKSKDAKKYIQDYLNFVKSRKSKDTYSITKGILNQFSEFLENNGIYTIDEINVSVLNDFIDQLDNTPKTKKNYLGVISVMLKQAQKEELIQNNPAKLVTLPEMTQNNERHRLLDRDDLKAIFKDFGPYRLYYLALLYTGLRAGDVSSLTYENIDFDKRTIISLIRKSRRIHELPLADELYELLKAENRHTGPIFPTLYSEDESILKENLTYPRKHLQTLLKADDRPHATLHSFRRTYNNMLRDVGLSIEDRQVLLTHTSSSTTKIYTNPNIELAREYINKIPTIDDLIKDDNEKV